MFLNAWCGIFVQHEQFETKFKSHDFGEAKFLVAFSSSFHLSPPLILQTLKGMVLFSWILVDKFFVWNIWNFRLHLNFFLDSRNAFQPSKL